MEGPMQVVFCLHNKRLVLLWLADINCFIYFHVLHCKALYQEHTHMFHMHE